MRGTIIAEIRRRIENGDLSPGQRLPTRRELEKEFKVSGVTVERAISQLIQEGFLLAKRRSGTFVSQRPPHLCRYGLVFGAEPSESRGIRFLAALNDEAQIVGRAGEREIQVFHGVDRHNDSEDFHHLKAQIRARRLAGLVFAFVNESVMAELLAERPDLPWLSTVTTGISADPTIVGLNGRSFMDKALDILASRGRRRIAVLSVTGVDGELADYLQKGMAARGMINHPYWNQSVAASAPQGVSKLMPLLMHPELAPENKPDGLIITDDNMVEHASMGLINANVVVPRDLDVVAHCNFPWPTPSVLPVYRLGYDIDELLQTYLVVLERKRRGERVPRETQVNAVTEEEWKSRQSAALKRGGALVPPIHRQSPSTNTVHL
jgi:DNA-binding LacI/PurR family transcriptional regulator